MADIINDDQIEAAADAVFGGGGEPSDGDWSSEYVAEEAGPASYEATDDRSVTDGTSHMTMSSVKEALGEVQPDSAVGGVHAVEEERLPKSISFEDVGQNSFEQNIAVKTWVDHAVDMLNRAEPESAILAELAHDGCPDPQGVLDMAQQQPLEPGEHEFEGEPAAPEQAVEESNTVDLPGITASYRNMIDLADERGVSRSVEVDGRRAQASVEYTDLWGDRLVRVAYEDDATVEDVAADRVQSVADAVSSPVDQIQSFIEQFPAADPGHFSSLHEARSKVREARDMCRSAILAGHSEAAAIEVRLASQEDMLDERMEMLAFEQASLPSGLPQFEIGAAIGASPSCGEAARTAGLTFDDEVGVDLHREIHERLPIMLHQAGVEAVRSGYARMDCIDHLSQHMGHLSAEDHDARLDEAEQVIARVAAEIEAAAPKVEKVAKVDPFDVDNDGPAVDLFW